MTIDTTRPRKESSLVFATLITTISIVLIPKSITANVVTEFGEYHQLLKCPRSIPKWDRTLSSTKYQEWKANNENTNEVENFVANCQIWPLDGVPLEHSDAACDRMKQNILRAVDLGDATESFLPEVAFQLPEEKTWICPLESTSFDQSIKASRTHHVGDTSNVLGSRLGKPTKWIVDNKASTPIILTHINHLGYEVSAHDLTTYPAHGNTAVFPHGPVVLPGQIAIVAGRQGHLFFAREYREDVVFETNALDSEEFQWNHYGVKETVKNVIPPTWSFGQRETRFETNTGIFHVMGHPGRVLMKHQMGLVYVRNEFGAMCPEISDERGSLEEGNGREIKQTDSDPHCNVLPKGFVNKVGCPVDLYFAPPQPDFSSTYHCELYSNHLGSQTSFDTDSNFLDLDAYNSPVKFEETYNSHVFVARMSHDQSLVARIEFKRDVVTDCPDIKKKADVIRSHFKVLENVWADILTHSTTDALFANSTKKLRNFSNHTVGNDSSGVLEKTTKRDAVGSRDDNILWLNRTGVSISATLVISA